MWQIVFFLIGVVFGFVNGADVIAFAGENVTLQCNGTSKATKVMVTWKLSDGTQIFRRYCEETANTCNTTNHSLGGTDRFMSMLTIWNVSLNHEDEYSFVMTAPDDSGNCKINLTVNVPPADLILFDKHHESEDEVLQYSGLLMVGEGENKTIVCKTNAVKPAVDLEWLIPEGLRVISDYGEQIQDEQDGRLVVSKRTLTFTPNYMSDEDILSLVCKLAVNSSEQIFTLIHIKNKGETNTKTEFSWTRSTLNQTIGTSDGDFEGIEVLKTTMTADVTIQTEDGMESVSWLQKSWAVIAGSSGGAILLLALATVVCIKKKMAVRGLGKSESTRDATQSIPSQNRGALPLPPSDQSSLNANHLPERHPSPTRSFRPAPPIPPPDIPIRQMVPVSDDTTGTTSENNRLRGATSRGASANSPATHSQRGLDNDIEYDMLNDMEYDVLNMEYAVVDKNPSKAHGYGSVPHVYRETTDGLAEYALVSRPKMGKNALQPRFRNTEQLDAEFEYVVVDKSHRTGRESVPHVFTQTMSGLEEYAVVNKPKDKKKRQPKVQHTTAPGDFEAEYAVVDKWKKNDRRIR